MDLAKSLDAEEVAAATPPVSNSSRSRKTRASRRPTAAQLIPVLFTISKLSNSELQRKPLEDLVGERCEPKAVCGKTVQRTIAALRPIATKPKTVERGVVDLWDEVSLRARPKKFLRKGSRNLVDGEDQDERDGLR